MRAVQFTTLLFVVAMLGNAHAGSTEQPALEKCGVLAMIDGKETSIVLPSFRVIELTAADGPFALPADAPAHVSAIQCGRVSIIPAKNDYKVLKAGFPFFIVAPDQRSLVMELSEGQLQVSYQEGKLTDEEIPLMQAYINSAQEYFYNDTADQKTNK